MSKNTPTEVSNIFDHYDVEKHYNNYIVTHKETGESETVDSVSEFDFVDDEAAAYLYEALGELPDTCFDEEAVKDWISDDPYWVAAALEHMSLGYTLGIDWAKEYVADIPKSNV